MAIDFNISILLDIYGNVLTEKQKGCLDLYYNKDLSLSEIAENYNISRQGVRDFIEKGKASLFNLENKIGVVNKNKLIFQNIDEIIKLSNSIINYNNNYCGSKKISNYAVSIIEIAKKIYND